MTASEVATRRGLLIAICGIDGSGKTTQELALERWLSDAGYQVLRTSQPTDWYRKSGYVREYLDSGVDRLGLYGLALFAAADRQFHVRSVIEPMMNRAGAVVLCNRYIYSTYAYFMARGLPFSFLQSINPAIPRPDLSILLDIDVRLARDRVAARDGKIAKYEERDLEFMARVRENFLCVKDESFLILSAESSAAEISERIRTRVVSLLESCVAGG